MERSKFYQFFPPPRFLQMPAVGLDVSDASMRFVELIEKRNGLVIGRFGERVIQRGIIESGEVKKPGDLHAIFSEIKKTFDLEFVSVSLPEEKAYLFELRLPSMKHSEIRGSIELVLEEHIPIKAEEAVFDYEITKDDDANISVSVVAIPRTLVDGYLEAFSGTGITPVGFDVETHAIARSVVPKGSNETFMIVDFGRARTGIAIVSEGFVKFTSTVPVGGGAVTDAISKNLKVPYEEAEKIKREKGVSVDSADDDFALAVMSPITVLRDEINRHQIYWQDHMDSYGKKRPPIQKIYLCGGGANIQGVSQYLSSEITVPVETGNTMVNVNTLDEYIPEISFNDSLRYATALGLALRRSL